MSPHRRRIGEAQDDIWKQNETAFRRLYLRERKALKDVKKVMESEHGFPTTPLSTYESKLRDLGLRKKMKKKDWHPVYQHYVNSGHRHTAIYFNGTRIPWDKAWKEIRRSGARECNDDGHIFGLPTDVVMRSPSPGVVARSAAPSYKLPIPWHLSDVSLVALSPTAMVHRSRLYEIPSNLLRMDMLNGFQQLLTRARKEGDKPSYGYHSHSLFNPTDSATEPTLPQSSSLYSQDSKHSDINSDIDELSGAFYRLANGGKFLVRPGRPLDESLEIVINKTPKYVLLKILEGDSPTVRAVVPMVARALSVLSRKDDFFSLIEVICRFHPEWIFHGQYHSHAGRLGCVASCQLLLRTWRQLKGNLFSNYDAPNCVEKMLISIIDYGHVECAKIMFGHVFGSSTALLQPENTVARKRFSKFLYKVAERFYYLERDGFVAFESRKSAVLHMLDWMLEAGVDVDLPPQVVWDYSWTRCTPRKWMPTPLDDLYFKNFKLYSRLVGHSTKFATEVTRSGIYRSAKEGIDSVRTYLLSRPSHTPAEQDAFLETVLTEELLRSEYEWHVDFNVIDTLLDYQIDLQKFRLRLSASAMLYHTINAASQQGTHPAVYNIIKTLMYNGAVIIAETMHAAIEAEGTTLLQFLSSYDADFKNKGALALCTASRLGNYEAVNQLLEMGVDINATLWKDEREREMTILALANVQAFGRLTRVFGHELHLFRPTIPPSMSCEMLEYLISRNVKLRANPADHDLRHLLYLVIENGLKYGIFEDTFNKTKVLLDAEPLTSDQPRTAPCLLEACFTNWYESENGPTLLQRLSLLNYLMDHGISASHSGVLALLIRNRAPDNEIRKVLDSGVDVDVYSGRLVGGARPLKQITPLQAAAGIGSLDWVRLLIKRGADVNRPAKGEYGRTALQAACLREPLEDGNLRNIDLIKFLIDNKADVNAPPASSRGVTALQAAAMRGHFEVVLLLLDNGAHINALPSEIDGYCALDGSVIYGRLDMVQFLLDLGALSYDRGESGYKGAIRCAEERVHSSIAHIIRQHALKNGKSGEELFLHHVEWEDYSSESGDDPEDTDEESGTCFENQDYWEDWLP